MQCEFYGSKQGAFFNYDAIAKDRKIKYAMLPDQLSGKLPGKQFVIPKKQPGEVRIASMDVALMSSTKHENDASAIFINQGIPTANRRYYSNIVYAETTEGETTSKQALRIRRLYQWYDCDYIVIDGKGVGAGIVDLLLDDIYDPQSNQTYGALSCCNNPQMAARCTNSDAPKSLYIINNQSAKFNSECAYMLREGLKSGRIRLLINEYDAEDMLVELSGYNKLNPVEKQMIRLPYEQTTMLIDELINLKHDQTTSGIRVYEESGRRKDRYSSLAYSFYVMSQIEDKERAKRGREVDVHDLIRCIRAPKIK